MLEQDQTLYNKCFLTFTHVAIDLPPLVKVLLFYTALCGRKEKNRKPHENFPTFIVVLSDIELGVKPQYLLTMKNKQTDKGVLYT